MLPKTETATETTKLLSTVNQIVGTRTWPMIYDVYVYVMYAQDVHLCSRYKFA